MQDNVISKITDFIHDRGGVFAFVWIFGMYEVIQVKSKTLFGLELNDAERGFAIVILSIICLVGYSAFSCFLAKKEYYDPKNLSDFRVNKVNRLRTLCQNLRHYRIGQKLPVSESDVAQILEMSFGDMQDLTPRNEPQIAYENLSNSVANFFLANSLSESLDYSERHEVESILHARSVEFLQATNWIKNRTHNTN